MTDGNPTNERSQRTPGYRYRPVDAYDMEDRAKDQAHQYDAKGDHTTGIDVRTAKPEDARRAKER